MQRILFLLAAVLCMAGTASAQSPSAKAATLDKALDNAMTPGEGQKRLDPMIGTFNVKIRTWTGPSKPPVETIASAVSSWVLGNRYVQTMLAGADADSFGGIGYAAYDNVSKQYQVAWMDNGSTSLTVYAGTMAADGKSAVLKATVANPVTGKLSPLEMRLSMRPDGSHASELWGKGLGSTMFKMMELDYTRVGK